MKEDLKLVKYYMVKPSIKTFGGLEITGETKFETENDDGKVRQKLESCVLTTELEQEYDIKDEKTGKEYKTTEVTKLTSVLPEGTILIWNENQGYTMLNTEMCTVEEGKRIVNELYDIVKDIK